MQGVGYSIAAAGDINGDHRDDLVIGAPYYSSNTGGYYVIYGNSREGNVQLNSLTTRDGYFVPGVAANGQAGLSLDVGQFNVDQFPDIIVSAPFRSLGSSNTGIVYVVFGGANYPTSQPTTQPSRRHSSQPSMQPSSQPSCQPSSQPSSQPFKLPSSQPVLSRVPIHHGNLPQDLPVSQVTNQLGDPQHSRLLVRLLNLLLVRPFSLPPSHHVFLPVNQVLSRLLTPLVNLPHYLAGNLVTNQHGDRLLTPHPSLLRDPHHSLHCIQMDSQAVSRVPSQVLISPFYRPSHSTFQISKRPALIAAEYLPDEPAL